MTNDDELNTPIGTARLGGPITVDSMLRDPARITRAVADIDRTRRLMLAACPPGPPPRRRHRIIARINHAREAIAFAIAPWLRIDVDENRR